MKIGIIGAGSMGLLFGSFLANTGLEIDVFTTASIRKTLSHTPLQVQYQDSHIQSIPRIKTVSIKNLSRFQKIPTSKSYDLLLITSKAYSLPTICQEYAILLNRQRFVGLLQNGIGNEEIVTRLCPNVNLFRILTTFGASYDERGIIIITGQGKYDFTITKVNKQSDLKDLRAIIYKIQKILTHQGIESNFHGQSVHPIWEKAIVNLSINALGGVTEYRNADILKSQSLLDTINEIIKETLLVAANLDLNLQSFQYYKDLTVHILKQTASNLNSLAQDLQKQKRTEIDFLNGKIVALGKEFGIATPINALLTTLVKIKEKKVLNNH